MRWSVQFHDSIIYSEAGKTIIGDSWEQQQKQRQKQSLSKLDILLQDWKQDETRHAAWYQTCIHAPALHHNSKTTGIQNTFDSNDDDLTMGLKF